MYNRPHQQSQPATFKAIYSNCKTALVGTPKRSNVDNSDRLWMLLGMACRDWRN
jgi:hypothetical protein